MEPKTAERPETGVETNKRLRREAAIAVRVLGYPSVEAYIVAMLKLAIEQAEKKTAKGSRQ